MLKKIRRICLVQPSMLLGWDYSRYAWPPLGILYLASAARDRGYEVQLVDSLLLGFDAPQPINEQVYLHGLTPEDLANRVLKCKPDLVGISHSFSNQDWCVERLAKLIKKVRPDCFIMVGGPIATLRREKALASPYLDGACLGDSDFTFPDYLDWLSGNQSSFAIPGAMYRGPGQRLTSIPLKHKRYDFDKAPLPARDLVDMSAYHDCVRQHKIGNKSLPATNMITSRGCPGDCVFCANPALHGRKFIPASPERVVSEMRQLVEVHGVKEIVLFDDNWSANRERAELILDLMLEADLGISWYPQDSAVWTMTDSILEKLAASGCYKIKFSIESGCQRVLKEVIKKPVDLAKAPRVVRRAKELGLAVAANYVIGFPDETRDELMETFNYAVELDADHTVFNIATPYNHTRLTQNAIEQGLLPQDFVFDSLMPGIVYWEGIDWTRRDLEHWRHEYWLKCNFGTPEKEAHYRSWALDNPGYKPMEKPDASSAKVA